jgi:transketolase
LTCGAKVGNPKAIPTFVLFVDRYDPIAIKKQSVFLPHRWLSAHSGCCCTFCRLRKHLHSIGIDNPAENHKLKMEVKQLQEICTQVRRDIVRMVHGVQSGHPGGSLGCTEFLVGLYFNRLRHRSPVFTMDGQGEDLFFLSNGHISPVFYSVLARSGYFEEAELGTFRKINSRLQGHPTTAEHLPGVRIASGSLGQGLSVGIGAALAKKQNGDPYLVYTLHGDGELQEGQIWEALMFAAANQVDNLIATVDWNGQQIDGSTEQVCDLGDLPAKFQAFGWEIVHVEQGNSMESVLNGLEEAVSKTGQGKPVVILLKTTMGHGVDFMMGSHAWHGIAPNDEQLAVALAQNPETLEDY